MKNFNKNLVDLDGKEIPESNIGKVIARDLVQNAKGDPLKIWHIAGKLHSGDDLDLDKSDIQMLKDLIKESPNLTILCKAQALECFE